MNLTIFEKILQKSWSKKTSYFPEEWDISNSSVGQCSVTALVVQDYFGGDVVWAEASLPDGKKISHYFNFINDKEVDLTRSQFPKGTTIPNGIEKKKNFSTTREYILSNNNTKERYELLRKAIQKNFNEI